jgi:hypothetical protein
VDLLILLGCFHFCWFEFGCSRDLPGMRGWGGVGVGLSNYLLLLESGIIIF